MVPCMSCRHGSFAKSRLQGCTTVRSSNPTCYVASNMCATSTMSLHPTPPTHPPQPHVLRSIQHVCNFNDVITPHPTHPPTTHPNPMCYVASNMCATSTMSLHPTPPTHPTQPTWQAWRKMHWSHRLQWAKHVPKRVLTSDWSQKQTWDRFGDRFGARPRLIIPFATEVQGLVEAQCIVQNWCATQGRTTPSTSNRSLASSANRC